MQALKPQGATTLHVCRLYCPFLIPDTGHVPCSAGLPSPNHCQTSDATATGTGSTANACL